MNNSYSDEGQETRERDNPWSAEKEAAFERREFAEYSRWPKSASRDLIELQRRPEIFAKQPRLERALRECSRMDEDLEEWLQAITIFTCATTTARQRAVAPEGAMNDDLKIEHVCDGRPIAALFRNGRPIPEPIRDLLASLFYAPDGNPFGVVFSVVPTKTLNQFDRERIELEVAGLYKAMRDDGMSAEAAAEETSKPACVVIRLVMSHHQ